MSSLLMRRLAPSSAAIPPAAEIKSGRFWAGSGQLVRHFDRRRSSSAGPAADPAGGEMHQRQNGSKGSRRGTRPGTAVTGATSAPLCVRVGWSGATTEGVDCQEKGKIKAFYALLRTSLRNPLLAKAQWRIPNRRLRRVPIARFQISTSATVSVRERNAAAEERSPLRRLVCSPVLLSVLAAVRRTTNG